LQLLNEYRTTVSKVVSAVLSGAPLDKHVLEILYRKRKSPYSLMEAYYYQEWFHNAQANIKYSDEEFQTKINLSMKVRHEYYRSSSISKELV